MIIKTKNQQLTLEELLRDLKKFPSKYKFTRLDEERWKANLEVLKLYALEHALNHGERPTNLHDN